MPDQETIIRAGETYCRQATAIVEDVDQESGIVQAKIVPYGVEAEVERGLFEIFEPGAFSGAIGNPSRCKVSDQQHNRSVIVGRAIELRDAPDGHYGKLKISDTSAGRDLLLLLREGVLEDLSVEFRPLAGKYDVERRGKDNILVRHRKAELVGVSPVSTGAYGANARVLAVRSLERDRAREEAIKFLSSLTAGRGRA